MNKALPLWLAVLVAGCTSLFAQNSYLVPTEIGNTFVRSEAASSAAAGDHVFVYQHQGAQVVAAGAEAGDVTDLAGAGTFAVSRIARVNGDTLFLAEGIRSGFDAGSSQLVLDSGPQVRTVMNASAPPFDGRTGGIVFRAATQQLTVAGRLDATGSGFRGGRGIEAPPECNFLTTAGANTYPLGNFRGSSRGEGVATVVAGHELGRAALANGGGGGNDHNTGGGGGANVTNGGAGGENVVANSLRCSGLFPGRGANGLPARSDRVYFGGGGGAGHANNTDGSTGGNGGGLIVLYAPQINFTGAAVLAADGAAAPTIDGDGAPGGGAAGTVLIIGENTNGSPRISLEGGAGGSTTNFEDRCFGPGGGGSGGRLLVGGNQSAFTPELVLEGGPNGLRLQSTICEETDQPAREGSDGVTGILDATEPFSSFTLSATQLCASDTLLVTDASTNADTSLWTIAPTAAGVTATPTEGGLAVSFADGTSGGFSITQTLVAGTDTVPGQSLSFAVDGLPRADTLLVEEFGDSVEIRVIGAQDFQEIAYDLGDGARIVSQDTVIGYRYAEAGNYRVSAVLLSDRCGTSPLIIVPVNAGERSQAIIFEKDPSGCAPLAIAPVDVSQGSYSGRQWSFPGGIPATSTEERPVVTYAEPGSYTATLTITGSSGSDTITSLDVTVFETPAVDFSFTETAGTVEFDNRSEAGTTSEWDFGDGNQSEEFSPTHSYASPGEYPVQLITRGEFCSDTVVRTVVVDVVSSVDVLRMLGISVYPNPTTGRVTVTGPGRIREVYDARGRQVSHEAKSVDLTDYPVGVYILRISYADRDYAVRVLRE